MYTTFNYLVLFSHACDPKSALSEWEFVGNTTIHCIDDEYDCQNCDFPSITKSFEIQNRVTEHKRNICELCIKDFYRVNVAPSKSDDEIISDIFAVIKDRRRKNRRKVTEPLMRKYPDEFSQEFMESRGDGYNAYDIYGFKIRAREIDLPMKVSDFDIASRTVEDQESIMGMPKWLFDEICEALPDEWQEKLERHFKETKVANLNKLKNMH